MQPREGCSRHARLRSAARGWGPAPAHRRQLSRRRPGRPADGPATWAGSPAGHPSFTCQFRRDAWSAQVHRRAPPSPLPGAHRVCSPWLPPSSFPQGRVLLCGDGDGAGPSPTRRLRRGRRTPGSRPVGSHGQATRQQAGCERTNGQLSAILSRARASASGQVFLNRTGALQDTDRPGEDPRGRGRD